MHESIDIFENPFSLNFLKLIFCSYDIKINVNVDKNYQVPAEV